MISFVKHNWLLSKYFIFIFLLAYSTVTYAQFYNKEYKAKILVRNDSEFYTFAATAENLTPTDVNLKYEFIVFNGDANNNISKNTQSDLFFIKGNDKKILSTVTVNYNETGKITIVLILYNLDGKPVGQDRLELKSVDGHQKIVIDEKHGEKDKQNSDQASPQDGIIFDGLVVENTLTKAGRDFYKYFYADYYNRGIKTKKNIVIEEVPGRMRTTRISVKIDGELIWQFFSQPKRDFLKSMAKTALERSIKHLQELQQRDESLTRY